MAYRAILGGSPLGLIGITSTVPAGASSTFNGGNSRNIKVDDYNTKLGAKHPGSLFTGRRALRAWPDISDQDSSGTNDVQYNTKTDNSSRKKLHSDSIYDTSILNIIEKLSGTKAELRPSDFAYLKNVGVYPNNRLVIARRFAAPSNDNIMVKKSEYELSPLAVLITWKPENEDFLDFTFGEEWEDADADFKSILTSLGEDVKMPGDTGGISGALGNVVPLPGWTEIFQRNVLAKLGVIDSDDADNIPAGNPNLIKIAKKRKTVGYGSAGSGLTCQVSIKMTCEYELKFISGIDPSIVWMDIIGMILRFGTSSSEGYGISKEFSKKAIGWINNPNTLVDSFLTAMKDAVSVTLEEVDEAIKNIKNTTKKDNKNPTTAADDQSVMRKLIDGFSDAITKAGSGLAQKYRVRLIGVINSLSGLPSTPWHVTIGNPMRPVFCSGDMLTTNVGLKLGPILAFNDLPSSITIDFTLSNARPWGLQEIMSKFNSGYLRTIDTPVTYYETGKKQINSQVGRLPFDPDVVPPGGTSSTNSSNGLVSSSTQSGTQSYAGTKNENSSKDPYSKK